MGTKQAFITGGAGGLGGATAELLVQKGWHVFVADFDEDLLANVENSPGYSTVKIDVTDNESVHAACAQVASQTDGLDAVINFAGILAIGSMIEMAEETLQRVIDINVMGTYRVNKQFIPLLEARKGRIINISSETGWQSGAPFNGAYTLSKHAVEAYSDSLRRELLLLGMHVVKIQPGPFRTAMVGSIGMQFDKAIEGSQRFKSTLKKVRDLATDEQKKSHDPRIVAEAVYTAITARTPKAAYSVKADPARSFLERLPTSWADRILKKVLSN